MQKQILYFAFSSAGSYFLRGEKTQILLIFNFNILRRSHPAAWRQSWTRVHIRRSRWVTVSITC